jgi:hypothetical protein
MTALALTLVSAVLAAIFACLAIVSWRKCAAALTETQGIASSLRSVRSKVETHDAELDSVTDALQSLRGKFYAERRKNHGTGSNSDDPTEVTDAGTLKDMLRRKAGIVAGRPAPHS